MENEEKVGDEGESNEAPEAPEATPDEEEAE